jgi:crotonobetainyl-CoA:carnitine CoA-transferase CaiB-like acyl-CoA transferase
MIALTAVYSITAALYHRERTGEGQSIEIPMFENMAQMVLAEHMGGATFDPPIGAMGYARLLSPFRRPYRTSDGHICALTYTDAHWRTFFEFVGRAELADDPRYRTLAARTDHIDEIYQIAEAEYAKRSTDEWVETLERLDIPVMRMNTLESLLEDPHLADVGFFDWAEHPTEGTVRTMATGSTWSKTQPDVRNLAPRLGEHSRELLLELGFSDGEINAMLREGVSAIPQDDRIVQESEC